MSEAAAPNNISRALRRALGGPDESAPKRVGRPSEYDPFIVAEAGGMLQAGATVEEVCEAIGISVATFYRWVRDIPGFREAMEKSKAAITRVEQSLFSRAVGKAVKRTTIKDPDGKITERIEQLPPDPRAQHLMLLNRAPDRWRNRSEHELIVPIADAEVSPEEQDTRRLALAAIALLGEAAEQPLTLDAVASYDENTEPADAGEEDDWEGETEDLDL